MPDLAIDVVDLKKSYGRLHAVRGVDLRIEEGEVYALLGPNGAGKTTIVEILEGHRRRSSGEVRVLGHDPARGELRLKERIGIVLQETGVERYLTVEEVVDMFRGYYPKPLPLDDIIGIVGLAEKRKTPVRKLSGGQQRRLDVAVGLAGDPELLFLDEPTTGFDPSARRNAWQMVRDLKALGKTILLTTHYMDEAQKLADRVGIIVQGKIVAEGPPRTLVAPGRTRIAFGVPADALPQSLGGQASVHNGRIELEVDKPTPVLHELTRWAMDRGVELQDLSVAQPTLEDVYLELTSRPERDSAHG